MKDDGQTSLLTEAREQLLRDAWLRHDALWFRYTFKHLSEDATNTINIAIVERLGECEMLSLVRKLRVKRPKSTDIGAIKRLLETGLVLYQTQHSPVDIEQLPGHRLQVSMHDCWACEAVRKEGMLAQYRCGPWGRLKGWLRALDITPVLLPDPDYCLALAGGNADSLCQVEVQIL